jgi:hypothetical protein
MRHLPGAIKLLLDVVACSPLVSLFVYPWPKGRFAYADSDFYQPTLPIRQPALPDFQA